MSAVAIDHLRRGWCPGTLTPMETGDGLLVRLLPPGGSFTPAQLALVCDLAENLGNGLLDVTARGNLQLRGLTQTSHAELVARLLAEGLVDEPEEKGPRRLTLTSPLAGRDPHDRLDARDLAAAITRAASRLPGLPAKIVVGVDGGGALPLDHIDVDIRVLAIQADRVVIGLPHGLWFGPLSPESAPRVVAGLLASFSEAARREPATLRRMRDLGAVWLCENAARHGLAEVPEPPTRPKPAGVGIHHDRDDRRAVLIALPFGQGEAGILRALARRAMAVGAELVRPTPWRGLALLGIHADEAVALLRDCADLRFITQVDDPRLAVLACPGAPACASGLVRTRHDAAKMGRAFADRLAPGAIVHMSGCAKGCAHPGHAAITLVGQAGELYGLIRNGTARETPERIGTLADMLAVLAIDGPSTP